MGCVGNDGRVDKQRAKHGTRLCFTKNIGLSSPGLGKCLIVLGDTRGMESWAKSSEGQV